MKLRERCYIRREKETVLKELPACTRTTIPVELTKEWRTKVDDAEYDVRQAVKIYAENSAKYKNGTEGMSDEQKDRDLGMRTIKAQRAETLVKIGILRQLVALGKMDAAIEWIENFLESGEKLVIFAWHLEIQEQLLQRFQGMRPARIMGKDNSQERQANVERFQNDPACKLIICSMAAGAEGLTLTAASNAFFIEHAWNPGKEDQAAARIDRMGQKYPTTIWQMDAISTIDDDMSEIISSKRNVIEDAAIGEDKNSFFANLLEKLEARIDN